MEGQDDFVDPLMVPDLCLNDTEQAPGSLVSSIVELRAWIERRTASIRPEDIRAIWDELFQAVNDTPDQKGRLGLSQIQMEILWAKLNCSEDFSTIVGNTNAAVTEIINRQSIEKEGKKWISGNTALVHCLTRTIQGKRWTPGMAGGRDGDLSVIDSRLFRENIRTAMQEINCLTTFDGISLAFELQKRRYKSALTLLIVMRSLIYTRHLYWPEEVPTGDWLRHFCHAQGIGICAPQELELVRRIHCSSDAVANFFVDVGRELSNIDPRLLLNMDETSLSGARRFDVLKVPLDDELYSLPLIVQQGKLPHLTGCITVSAAGKLFKPMIIVPNLKQLKSLQMFTDEASFASSVTGWINSDLFLIWARDIVAQISWYRQQELPPELRHNWIVIVVDGHMSRFNLEACRLLNCAHIALLLLPPHTTHVLQPIDVGLTAPTKSYFKQKLGNLFKASPDLDASGHEQTAPLRKYSADELRYMMVAAFLHGIQAGCTCINIRAAWEKSGLYPFCPERALKSQFIAHSELMERILGSVKAPRINIHPFVETNHRVLSSDEGLAAFAEHVLHRPPTPEELTMDGSKWQEISEKGRVTRGSHNVSLTGMRRMLIGSDDPALGGMHIIHDHN
jgi:hypothetical protein